MVKHYLLLILQYDTESGLPKYSDTNNEGFSDLFIGAKPK